MKKVISKLFRTRIRMDLRDGCPLVANYFLGIFIEAIKYNPKTKMFDIEISEDEYMYQLN